MRFQCFFAIDSPAVCRAPGRLGLLALFCLVAFSAGLAQAADSSPGSTPFEQAVNAALTTNPKILSAKATLAATQEKYAQGLAALFPDINLIASRTQYSDTWTDTSNSQSPDRFNLSLIQPLFRRPLLKALQQTKPLMAAAEEEYNVALQGVLLETIQAMVTLQLTENVERLAEDNLVLSHRNLDAALTRRRAGDLTRTDVDQATARVSSSEAELIRAKNDAMVARARFEETVGMEVPEGLEIPDVPAHLLRGSLQDLTNYRVDRPDLKAAGLRVEAADVAVEIEKSGHYPYLDLQANAVTFQGGEGASAARIDGEYQYSVALQLTVPLFSGGKVLSRTREALDNREVRRSDLQRVEKQAIREINQAHLLMHSAKATVSSAEAALRFNKEAVKGLEEEFAAGFRTVTQLFELQNQLFRAKTDLVKNRYELVSSQYQLLHTFGHLTLAHLQLPDTLQADGMVRDADAVDTGLFTRFIDSLKKLPPADGPPAKSAQPEPLPPAEKGPSPAPQP
ncbi:MAG: TolC family outer membrane protein [Magnetococcus sp. MYC-9]